MDNASEALAIYLADRLNDWHSIAWYRQVTRRVSPSIVRDALVRTLDVPASCIRKSRAAYFTTLIRGHVRRGRHEAP